MLGILLWKPHIPMLVKNFYIFHGNQNTTLHSILSHLNYPTHLQSISSSSILNLSSKIFLLVLIDTYPLSVYRCSIYISLRCARHPGHRILLDWNTLINRTRFFLNKKLHLWLIGNTFIYKCLALDYTLEFNTQPDVYFYICFKIINPLAQGVRFKFPYDAAYALASYGHSRAALLRLFPLHRKPQ